MADNSYTIEIKPASKNGWSYPSEAMGIWGVPYERRGITVHWWGDGTGASNHDNIVNYMNNRAANGQASVNYVLSDNKITLCVNPDNIAWCSQAGNPITISVETQPTLHAEGYKKWGWLVDQLEQRYGKSLILYKHSNWFATACPGTIDLARIRAEANKWKSGGYDPQPAPAPTPPPAPAPTPPPPATVNLTVKDIANKKVKLIRTANLWNLQFVKYTDAKAVTSLPAGTEFEVSAVVTHPTGSIYYMSEYSFAKGITNGVNVKDTDHPDPVKLNDPISPPPVVIPTPVEPPNPEPVEPPVVVDPGAGVVDKNVVVIFLQGLIDAIKSFIDKLKG